MGTLMYCAQARNSHSQRQRQCRSHRKDGLRRGVHVYSESHRLGIWRSRFRNGALGHLVGLHFTYHKWCGYHVHQCQSAVGGWVRCSGHNYGRIRSHSCLTSLMFRLPGQKNPGMHLWSRAYRIRKNRTKVPGSTNPAPRKKVFAQGL